MRGAAIALALPLLACGGANGASARDAQHEGAAGGSCARGDADLRPMIVAWDAASVADFETAAKRGAVFVRYDGCDLRVLDCYDPRSDGRFGAYRRTQITGGGGVSSVDYRSADDVRKGLPIGGAALAAKLADGEAVQLRYVARGVREVSRRAKRAEIAVNPACSAATHLVAAFNVGAFELRAGGSLLRSGGSTALSCVGDSRDAPECEAPIRLTLEEIAP